MLLFWYCMDDWAAEFFGNPALGHIPIWVVLVGSLMLGAVQYSARRD